MAPHNPVNHTPKFPECPATLLRITSYNVCYTKLLRFGIRCVIAPSFADIFFNNCFKNGILPIALPQEQVDLLMKDAEKGENARMTIDLEKQEITTSEA